MSRSINNRFTLPAYLTWSLYLVFGMLLVSFILSPAEASKPLIGGAFNSFWLLLFVNLLIALTFCLGLWAITFLQIKHRQDQLMQYCVIKGLRITSYGDSSTFSSCSITGLAERDVQFKNLIVQPDWEYAELTIPTYSYTKNGDYKSQEIYYGIMAVELPRALPNIFFDSKKARGKQFKSQFASRQQHSLEGDFDNYFVTYFPPTYTIDGLSVITPEVMEALEEAQEYDVEILGNRLYLYGPLLPPAEQLSDMYEKAANIKQKLLNNILTYRDQRLPSSIGRQRVALEGMRLQKAANRWWIGLIFVVLYYLVTFLIRHH